MSNNVNHPKHYNEHSSDLECIEIKRYLTGSIGDAFKYIWRRTLKKSCSEDLDKAIWYILDDKEHNTVRISISGMGRVNITKLLTNEPNPITASIFQFLILLSSIECDTTMYDLTIKLILLLKNEKTDSQQQLDFHLDPDIDHCDLDNI